ncbi:hypothetical protein [Flavobacterium ajazii]|uniref:hypothetical protein n=1 Tax=Flavobacterium ajazii TaxID=2692318 RepID=UPI001FE611B4|nr:hypothetical protein [Flavobacterium ajazii]
MMDISTQIFWLFTLAIPIACISWTVTNEEVFREPREWCINHSQNNRKYLNRKFFYLFTCEYCFSHYITLFFILFCNFRLLIPDWRGYIIAGFSLVFLANIYMSFFALLRQTIKKEKVEIKKIETDTSESQE